MGQGRRPPLPQGVWLLGFVSLLMDVSSESIHSLLPLFLTGTLHASVSFVGVLEGLAESTALIVRIFSGTLSDWLGRRKALAVAGYGLGALSKPLFALATAPHMVLAARLLDRLGKGIRGAPRDALIADFAAPEVRGAAFGLRQSLDTIGAFVGPFMAVALLAAGASLRTVFWIAALPGTAAVLLLAFGLREPQATHAAGTVGGRRNPLSRASLASLPASFWWVVTVGGVFTLARFSEAFLVLRARDCGVPLPLVPLVMVGMNIVFALAAYPFGRLADVASRRLLLAFGLAVLIGADLVLASAQGPVLLAVGVGLWGLHMGATQGLLAAMVADAAPPALRGTAFGGFNLVAGIAMLIASSVAGALWQAGGAALTFRAGAGFAALALLALLRPVRHSPRAPVP